MEEKCPIELFRDKALKWIEDEDNVEIIPSTEKFNIPSISVAIKEDGETLYSLNILFNDDEEDVSAYVDFDLHEKYIKNNVDDYMPESDCFNYSEIEDEELKAFFLNSFWACVKSLENNYL